MRALRPVKTIYAASHWLLAGMRIAVIGKGNIGGSLGGKWLAGGHDVVYGAREASGQGPGGAPVRSIGDALQQADVVVLAVPGQAVPDVVGEHGAAFAGKVVIDAVNRIGAPELDSRALIAAAAPSARYVRVQLAGLGELRRGAHGLRVNTLITRAGGSRLWRGSC
jgi:predicted dinucleotide-binding enzyme